MAFPTELADFDAAALRTANESNNQVDREYLAAWLAKLTAEVEALKAP